MRIKLPKDWMSVPEWAKHHGISPFTVYYWVYQDKIAHKLIPIDVLAIHKDATPEGIIMNVKGKLLQKGCKPKKG